jgi:SAM-dependent methyltransferase
MSRGHEQHNREFWDADAADYQAAHGTRLDEAPFAWGAWRIPEADLDVLGNVDGLDILEFGCGAAQWSRALADLGGRPVGLDQSQVQLGFADRGLALVCASGEAVPLRDASFDIVFCDHGAMSFCDPERTVAEAARLIRPGGLLAFCVSSFVKWLTDDDDGSTRKLQRQWFQPHEIRWPEGVTEFQLPYGDWIRLFHRNGFEVEDLVHLRAPKGAETTYTEFVDYRWSRRWPAEEIWTARLR